MFITFDEISFNFDGLFVFSKRASIDILCGCFVYF